MRLLRKIFGRSFGRNDPPASQSPQAAAVSVAERKEWREFLGRCPPFSRLSRSILEVLLAGLYPQRFAAGEYLVRQGDQGDSLFVLREGRAAVNVRLEDGSTHELATVSPGHVVGEMSLLTREPRNADVVALTPVDALVLPVETFNDLSSSYPQLCVVLTDLLAERLGHSELDGLGSKLLEGYRIKCCIGKGGMAVVYEAVEESTGRSVALKMMSHRLVYDSDALDRFQREADVAESLEHENITRVYSRFEAYRTHFLVMELCDGPTLQDLVCAHGPLEEPVIRSLLGQLANALDHVHSQVVLHRDLKPSNVMINRDGVCKLTDFGLALPSLAGDLTRSGTVVGTPAYMAPEQLAGQELDERIDVYALGCTAYEMIKGKGLFDAPDLTALIYQKLTWSLPKKEDLRPELSDELYELLQTTLAKDPKDRSFDLASIRDWAQPVDSALVSDLPDAESAPHIANAMTQTEIRPPPKTA
ncbi:MAG: protein kinase [Planctomycetota bacterium]